LAESFFDDVTLGKLVPGAAADLMIVDYYPYTPLTTGNFPWHVLFGFEASMVRTTIASGRILMDNHKIMVLNEQEIMAEARTIAPAVWERYQKFATMTEL
jgi:cytosine/adenosine deaminase-related metal-dependent hydrolase